MNKTLLTIASSIACVVSFLSGCGSSQSTHHASMRVLLEPISIHGGVAMAQRKEEASKYLPSLTAVLEESGLQPVTDANTSFNMISFDNRESDEVLKFKGKATSKDNTIPLEALIIIDSKEYESIHIYLSEGYSFGPSDQLTQLYKKLDQALEPINGHKTSSMW